MSSRLAIRWNYDESEKDFYDVAYGIALTPQTISFDEIDFTRSLHNQNRGEVDGWVNPQWVEDFVQAMRSGFAIPAPVYRRTNGSLYALDGNHRTKAAQQCGAKSLDVWVCETDDDTAAVAAMTANIRNGNPIDHEHRMRNALYLLGRGWDIDRVARASQVTPDTVKNYKKRQDIEAVLEVAWGVNPPKMSASKLDQIGRFEKEHLEIIGPDLAKATPALIKECYDEIKAAPSSQRKMKAFEVAGLVRADTTKDRGMGRRDVRAVTEVRKAWTTLLNHLEKAKSLATAKDHKEWMKKRAEVDALMDRLFD